MLKRAKRAIQSKIIMATIGHDKFLSLTVDELQKYLRERGVPVGDEKRAELAERAFWADKLGLTVKPTDKVAEQEIEASKSAKLILDGGMVRLPRPETLTEGWEDGPASLPETCRDHLDSYIKAGNRRIGLIKTEGRRTLALGKSLYMSRHVRALQYHGISVNLCYCFVRGKVIPQVKTSEQTYFTWVVLHKETGQVCTAECTCCVGIQATCKHIAGLLFAVVESVEEGRNASCTSQRQAWGRAPKKGEVVHDAEFAKNISIIGVKADVTQQLPESNRMYRSEFDPRTAAYRVHKPVSSFNLDALASITNGNCGLLMYNKPKPDPHHQLPNIKYVKTEETVETSCRVLNVSEAFEIAKPGDADSIIDLLRVTKHQQAVLAKETARQAASSLWAEQRQGRVTASVVGDCVGCVKDDGSLSGHSQVARVLNYYGSPRSAALDWGKTQEPVAKKQYVAWHRLHHQHKGVACDDTGLWISTECPYVAASPDGIVRCKECGTGLLEIKNPYTHRLLDIEALSTKKGSCLTMENGVLQLRRSHQYYAQVQVQMWCTGYKWSDFVVRTVSKSNNIYVERILFDEEYIANIQPKLYTFFVNGVVAELLSGAIRKVVTDKSVRKVMESILVRIEKSRPSSNAVHVAYPCGVCNEECDSDPGEDGRSSIGCDVCNRWFHYSCVGIQGSEGFLKKRKSVWKCSACNSKTKGKKRKRQPRAT
ncbi:uncharacterized protein LOC119743813 [Patiria miniata]|uniref:Uncharacterized protein n=1 Tax=Patiria miniata TaxID=46514 RepID=A0A914BKJ5_PATMI|nr:uncharacterized protein LOC119743813 [Patiria miniata]